MTPQLRQSINAIPKLTRELEAELITRFQQHGCLKSRDRVINAHLKMVAREIRAVCKTQRGNPKTDDLFQEGALGLLHAIRKFDLSKGVRFAHYAKFWIRHYAQVRMVADWNDGMPLPNFNYGRFSEIVRCANTGEKLSGLTERQSDELKHALNDSMRSLDYPVRGPDGDEFSSMCEALPSNDHTDATDSVFRSELTGLVDNAMCWIPEKRRQILKDVLAGGLSESEAAKRHGVSRQYVGQVKRKYVKRLQNNAALRRAAEVA